MQEIQSQASTFRQGATCPNGNYESVRIESIRTSVASPETWAHHHHLSTRHRKKSRVHSRTMGIV